MKRLLLIAALVFASGAGWALQLEQGAPVQVHVDPRLPREAITLVFDTGARALAANARGLPPVLYAWVRRRSIDLSNDLSQANASLNLSLDGRAMELTIQAPPKSLPRALALAVRVLSDARLDESDFPQLKAEALQGAQGSLSNVNNGLAYFAARDAWQGDPELTGAEQGPAAIQRLSYTAAQAGMLALFDPSRFSVAATGPVMPTELVAQVQRAIGPWLKGHSFRSSKHGRPASATHVPKGVRVRLWPRAGQKEAMLLWIAPWALKREPRAHAAAAVYNRLLGEPLTGRLARDLRIERGWTYNTHSSSNPEHWSLYSQCDTARLAELLQRLPLLLDQQRKAVLTEVDLAQARKALSASFIRAVAQPGPALGQRLFAARWLGDPDFYTKKEAAIWRLSAEDVAGAARAFDLVQGTLYVVGDEARVRDALSKVPWLGNNIKILDTDGL